MAFAILVQLGPIGGDNGLPSFGDNLLVHREIAADLGVGGMVPGLDILPEGRHLQQYFALASARLPNYILALLRTRVDGKAGLGMVRKVYFPIVAIFV